MTLVLTEDHGPVRHVILNRPEKRNAFNGELVAATGEALRDAAADPDVRCVVLRGAGPMFSSGMDLGALAALAEAPENLRAFRREILDAWNLAGGDDQADDLPDPRRVHRRRAGARAGLRPARGRHRRRRRHARDADRPDPGRRRLAPACRRSSGSAARRS